MMNVSLRPDLITRHSHQQRLAVAHRLADVILARHGDSVVAIVVFGSTAVDSDGPFSDLDVTAVTREDLGNHSKCYPCKGLQINLDYQTVEESLDEAREPQDGGCWLRCIPVYDHGAMAPQGSNPAMMAPRQMRQHQGAAITPHGLDVGTASNAAEDRSQAFVKAGGQMANLSGRILNAVEKGQQGQMLLGTAIANLANRLSRLEERGGHLSRSLGEVSKATSPTSRTVMGRS